MGVDPWGWWEGKWKHSPEQNTGRACGEKVFTEMALLDGKVCEDKEVSACGGSGGGAVRMIQSLQSL